MSFEAAPQTVTSSAELQIATFYVGDLLLGVDICDVQEINRQLDVTRVPKAPDYVRGVINLRGEVATVINLRRVLGLDDTQLDRDSRNLIVHSHGEAIGLLVDRIADILTLRHDDVLPAPENIEGVDSRYFKGVHPIDDSIVVLLDVDAVLTDRN